MNLWPTELLKEIEKCNETSLNAEKKFKAEAYKPKYLGKWVGDGLIEGLEKPVAPSVDKALDRLRYAMIDTSKISKNNQFIINIDKKENNNMATSITNDAMPKYEEIKDDLQVTSMSIDHSPYAAPTVKIEGYIPLTLKVKEKNRPNNEPKFPQCKGIIRRGNTTRVDWADDTRTIVILEEGKEDLDMFHTFCIAFTKKMLGSTTKILKTIENCDTDTIEKKRKEAIEKANREAEEETKKLKAEMENAAFEAAVQKEIFEHRVIEEAIRRIQVQDERRMNEEEVEVGRMPDEDEVRKFSFISAEAERLKKAIVEAFSKLNETKDTEENTDEIRE